MEDADGVIARLGEVGENPNPAFGFDRPSHDCALKQIRGDDLGAGKGEDDATGTKFGKGELVQAFVGHDCGVAGGETFGKGGWIEDDHVIVGITGFEEVKDISGDRLVGHLMGIVEGDILFCPGDRAGGTVDGVDERGT